MPYPANCANTHAQSTMSQRWVGMGVFQKKPGWAAAVPTCQQCPCGCFLGGLLTALKYLVGFLCADSFFYLVCIFPQIRRDFFRSAQRPSRVITPRFIILSRSPCRGGYYLGLSFGEMMLNLTGKHFISQSRSFFVGFPGEDDIKHQTPR